MLLGLFILPQSTYITLLTLQYEYRHLSTSSFILDKNMQNFLENVEFDAWHIDAQTIVEE